MNIRLEVLRYADFQSDYNDKNDKIILEELLINEDWTYLEGWLYKWLELNHKVYANVYYSRFMNCWNYSITMKLKDKYNKWKDIEEINFKTRELALNAMIEKLELVLEER